MVCPTVDLPSLQVDSWVHQHQQSPGLKTGELIFQHHSLFLTTCTPLASTPSPLRVHYKFCAMMSSQNDTRLNMIKEQDKFSSNWARVPVSLPPFTLDLSEATCQSVTPSLAKLMSSAFKTSSNCRTQDVGMCCCVHLEGSGSLSLHGLPQISHP